MPFTPPWRSSPPDGLSERAKAAWVRSDWRTVSSELVAAALSTGDAGLLAPVVENDAQMVEESYLMPHVHEIELLPDDPLRDAALAYLAVRADAVGREASSARSAVAALVPLEPRVAATVAVAIGLILADRGRLAEADWFLSAAQQAIEIVREVESEATAEELWFGMMTLAVIVEWDTYAGSAAHDRLSAALAPFRAQNLLRSHHARALLAVGHVIASRGEFGAAAVSMARGVRLLPDNTIARASAQARLALVRFRQGDWAAARHEVHAVATADVPPNAWLNGLIAALDALQPALSGDLPAARERIAVARETLAALPSMQAEAILLHARIAYTVGGNDWSGMIQILENAEEPGYRRIYTDHEWRALWGMALRNAGRMSRYRDLVQQWGSDEGAAQHPYYWSHVALLAQVDRDAAAALDAAYRARDLIGDGDDPLGRTWVRIVVGTIVSLYGDPTEGIVSHEAARAELVELGANAFVRVCTRIIENIAAEVARKGGDALGVLTAQQRRIAELVAEGYTSAEIGQILYLSKKTIDFHVANIVSRLGLSGRRELKRRLVTGG